MWKNDIAILRLKDPILFSQYNCMRPICVPKFGETFRNVECTVTGWGVTEPYFDIFNPPLSDVLLKVQIPIVDDSICIGIYDQAYYRNTNICAGDLRGGKDSCGGDSGGPLICRRDGRDYVAGIVSAGSGCAQINKSAIYTDVSAYTDWINNYIRSGK
ncbi:prostasin [Patella vulgata]|uniref:prostasin n=1 Tax=Patella vulgata TaxID=6465 RepID=UPI0021804740|nr:prostasin [Patella vulgata]